MSLSRRAFVLRSGLTATGLGLAQAALPVPAAAAAAPAKTAAKGRPAEVEAVPALRPDDWESVRAQFRLDPDYAHLSSFYIVSHPAPVRQAIERHRRALDDNPFVYLESHLFERPEDNLWMKVTAAAAEYIGGKPQEIALTSSTTAGLALIYGGLRLRPGQEILTTTHDHFVHHESIRLAAARGGANVRRVALYDSGATATADAMTGRLASAIGPRTRVVGITWVHSSTGVRTPVRRIADAIAAINRNRSAAERVLLVVDGVHGFGAIDESVAALGCDFFSSGTHKWILAPRGTGLVWAQEANWALLQPTVPSFMDEETYVAWMEGRTPDSPTSAARISPGGFLAFEHQWAAVEAFRFHKTIGRARVAGRIAELNGRIKKGLAAMSHVTLHTPIDPGVSAGINCFEVRGMPPAEVVHRLLERRVVASTSPYKVAYVRLAAGLMNSTDDVDRALQAVGALAG